MTQTQSHPYEPHGTRRRALATTGLTVASLTAVVILAMAALTGQAWFGGQMALIRVHGMIGGIALLGALALSAITFIEWRRSGRGQAQLALSVALFVLMLGQTALGMSGRASTAAAALHIPNGVLVTMVAAAVLTLAASAGSRVES